LTIATRTALRIVSACVLLGWCARALALDPTLDVSQYAHSAWKIRDGFFSDAEWFAQTSDGYLWLGGESGLTRFDGVRSVPWLPPKGASLPNSYARVLLATRDGALWIGTLRGLARWHGGKLTTFPQLDGETVNGLFEDREGTVWIGAASRGRGKVCAIRKSECECSGDDGTLGAYVGPVYEDSKGNVWVAAASGLWHWKPGAPRRSSPIIWFGGLQGISESADGTLLVEVGDAVVRVLDDKVEALPLPALQQQDHMSALLRDRDGGLWIGTQNEGLLHVHGDRTDVFSRADGLSGETVWSLFEDREGNIWVATSEGIDRFRTLAAATTLLGRGMGNVEAIAADRDGSIWVSTDSDLERWNDGHVTIYRPAREKSTANLSTRIARPANVVEIVVKGLPDHPAGSLFQDSRGRLWLGTTRGLGYLQKDRFVFVAGVPDGYIDSIAEDGEGHLWIAHRDAGLLRLSADGGIRRVAWSEISQNAAWTRVTTDPVGGGVWLGFFAGGIVHFVDGRVRESYSVRDGLGNGAVNHLQVDRDGTLWVATEGGLSRVRNGRIATLDSTGGLPCDSVDWVIDDDSDKSHWLYMSCGLVRIARADLDAWSTAVDEGTASRPKIRAKVLDSSDGVRSIAGFGIGSFAPHAAKSRDGKLWLKAQDGLTMVDPRHLAFNTLPPPVHVEQIVADRKPYDASLPVQLPPLVRDLRIDYTALSFVAPERVLFRYMLEGRDRDWHDAGNRRQAFYTDLAPGNYRFRVIAANNSGVWNQEGASLAFSVAPAYWQTNWFRVLCVLAFIALLLVLYRLRVRQLARAFNRTLDARVNERTRIARELHDTLLQSFHGLLLRFQTARALLPANPTKASEVLDGALDQAADAITEGRDAVQGLRAPATETNDLAVALRTLGDELAAEGGKDAAALQVEVQGTPRTLHPIVRDEIFRIASEALHNAFRHAAAKQIEVELRYDDRQLGLGVRDDGKGVDPKILSEGGREGHFGMHGMRERAQLIGGKLTVWSAPDSGTEVELSIPASHAYAISSSRRRFRFAEKLYRQGTTSDS